MMFGIISLAAYDSASENSKFPETAPTAYGSKEAAESDSIFIIHNDAKPTNIAKENNRKLQMVLQELTLKNTAIKTKKSIVDKVSKTEVFGGFILALLLLLALCMRCKA